MDSEQQAPVAASTSTISSIKASKIHQEPSVGGSKSQMKEITDAGKSTKPKKTRKGNINKTPAMRSDPQIHEKVKGLHERTKNVKSKLTKLKQTMVHTSDSRTSTSSRRDSKELSELEILLEIERLKDLVKEMRINSSGRKERRNSVTIADIDDDNERADVVKKQSAVSKPGAKHKRRRVRPKNRKKVADDNQLEKLYEGHINRIVRGSDDEKPELAHLNFQFGDDLEILAKKCVADGLGCIVAGELRVNAKNNHQAFITMAEGTDAMVSSMAARCYAMEGDLVEAFVRNPETEPKLVETIETMEVLDVSTDDGENLHVNDIEILKETKAISTALRRHAFVIRVVEQLGNRVFVGSITFKNPVKHDEEEFFKFKPRDTKVPMIYISVDSCQEVIEKQTSDDAVGFLYIAKLIEIKDTGRCIGSLQEPVGKCGDLESEIKAILLHNGLKDVQPFEERFEQMWSENDQITPDDLEVREDLRNECVFTIDPLTARDLDDAVSCKLLANGSYEIGVHISDVSKYLEEKSELDELVKLRATSIYLVNEVIHMLPKSLCMKCSLLPCEDKFTLSVFWVINKDAEVLSTRFSRTIIRSCTQFAYEHAQKIIDNPDEIFTVDDFPTIHNGFSVADIVERIKHLNALAEIMRTKRFEDGSLSIDKPQIYFQFDPKTGEPTAYEIASRLTANFLIEEFMLLANRSVADFIYKRFPDISFLRRHEPPKPSAIKNLKTKLSAAGIELDMSSSKSIFKGLTKICGMSNTPEDMSAAMNYLLTKPMMRAKYFCSESVSTSEDLYHYALAIPIYTHFTSPIRRYPDVLVHRLLSAALDYTPPPTRTPTELHELASICNEQKFNAKNAGEESTNLYFLRYVKARKSINLRVVITDIYQHSMEAITLATGHLIPIQFRIQHVVVDASKAPTAVYISEKGSSKQPLEVRIFSALEIKLMIWDGKLAGFFISPDKDQRVKNNIIASQSKPETPRKKTAKKSISKD